MQTPAFGGDGLRLAVVRFRGPAKYFQVTALRGRFSDSADGLVARVTPGAVRGHSTAAQAFSTAAAPAAGPLPFDLEPGDPPDPAGPYPDAFQDAQAPERFTSDGPRRMFFAADGTPFTPGDFSSTGGMVRQKPDVTAADGVSTGVPGFAPFFGTSAAAPHAAAIAALILSGNPDAGTDGVREAFTETALDLLPAGVDGRTGQGIVRADRALDYTGATPQPLVEAGSPVVTPAEGDGDAFLEAGESATVTIPASNVGDGTATGVSVTTQDDDPRTTITPRAQSYGDIAPGATAARDWTVELADAYPLGRPMSLSLRVAFAGRLSPTTSTVAIATGRPATTPTTFRYEGAPVPIPDASAAGASVTIPVSGLGYTSGVRFSIDGESCSTADGATTVGLDHTFVRDLTGTLTAPDGRTATLFEGSGGSGNNLCQVVFADRATESLTTATEARAPFTGTWRPIEPLAALVAGPADGDWTFRAIDTAARDTGSIRAVSLELSGFVADREVR